MRILRLLPVLAIVLSLSACVTAKKDYTEFRQSDPHSILVVPVTNKTAHVSAADYFMSTISVPLAERGYYVYPVHLVKRMMEDEGLSDADMVHAADTTRLAEMFGADTVLYISIDEWTSNYLVIRTDTYVGMSYILKDGKTGKKLWEETGRMHYSPNGTAVDPLGLIVQMAVAAAERIAPNYMPLARQLNSVSLNTELVGIPNGPYSQKYGKDLSLFPSAAKKIVETEASKNAQQRMMETGEDNSPAAQKLGPSTQ